MFCSFLSKMIPPYQTPLGAGAGVALVSLRTDKSSLFQIIQNEDKEMSATDMKTYQ